ncbi:uncharacterized protein LOC110181952 [Drosophila serrata]|uniref:uncharacterized protein LOC110181952 n=1 Tax=Drosophila serrata TaxID=7274 RepID=UPI000A1CFB4D|nr:uncharacterized protein LOC110181952 [Drosophila serrata]XP_020805551.1 uncharacterized protein LOC110181952 [Drosophila serrata]
MKLKEPCKIPAEENDLFKEAHRAIEENGVVNDEEDPEEFEEVNGQLDFLNALNYAHDVEANADGGDENEMSSDENAEEDEYCPVPQPQGFIDTESQDPVSPFGCGSDMCPVCSRL